MKITKQMSIGEVLEKHGVDADTVVKELNEAAEEGAGEGPSEATTEEAG
jgi:hypothetical protein